SQLLVLDVCLQDAFA
ncbi:TPA: DUF645 family protein, partial [Vibrio cholerae]|nr:DUF645 family protein [Vibrio cholerae]HBK8117113.1 DUF645 family protein [Vibrio cholerae]HBK8124676.1 DUF645 family protein [Vibrio cholerae]HBK8139568.1 DUF645 family protein [Vibrio cholerae]HBK8143210.1 DUF645 family protein [Vibrio cholerae]